MDSLESILRDLFTENGLYVRDYTSSMSKLDFTIHLANGTWLKVDAKEKRQPLKRSNWPVPDWIEEGDEFILDDLSARKLLLVAPYSTIVVYDIPRNLFFTSSVLSLWTMPRVRVNRNISKNRMKGKWLLSLKNFTPIQLDQLVQYFETVFSVEFVSNEYKNVPECYGSYIGEDVGTGGEYRTKQMREYDYSVTR